MNLLYRILLTLNATSWMLIIYAVKEQWTFCTIPYWALHIAMVLFLILLSWIALLLSRFFGDEPLNGCKECSLADNEFLPVYLGYFFVSLSVNNCYTMSAIYFLVFAFTFLSQTQYFNPVYLLFGYHYYHILTDRGTKVFIIKHGKVVRNKDDINLNHLRRINDSTYIERG